eukprot:m.331993 g.331993  ORF g.331993 m.331993 type:complete len:312 (-) comp55630_c0_seq4:240-1175(-)
MLHLRFGSSCFFFFSSPRQRARVLAPTARSLMARSSRCPHLQGQLPFLGMPPHAHGPTALMPLVAPSTTPPSASALAPAVAQAAAPPQPRHPTLVSDREVSSSGSGLTASRHDSSGGEARPSERRGRQQKRVVKTEASDSDSEASSEYSPATAPPQPAAPRSGTAQAFGAPADQQQAELGRRFRPAPRVVIICDTCDRHSISRHQPELFMSYRGLPAGSRRDPTSPCDVCGGALNQPVPRILHGFECHRCNRRFARADRLIAHASRHSGVKAFPCDMCAKSFSRYARLVTHHGRFHSRHSPDDPQFDKLIT